MIPSNRGRPRFHRPRRALLIVSLMLLASCRLVITTDETGHIVSASGRFDCASASCAFPITEEVAETFTAIPAEGYRFAYWRGLCRRATTEVCHARVMPLPEKFSKHDGDIGLVAVFEPSDTRRPWYRDRDGDGYGAALESRMAFERPAGFVGNSDDCDDTNAEVRPWAKESNDGQDNDCDGDVDEGFAELRFHRDADGDGFGDPDVARMASFEPEGYVRNARDCDDSNSGDHPEAREVADGRDNDCDGQVDEGGTALFRDVDGDGFGTPNETIESLEPVPGYVENGRDCDDNNASIYPAAREEFDSLDNDCDGTVDEGFTLREYYRDADGDGYGDASKVVSDISRPGGYVSNGTDNCPEIYNPDQSDGDQDGRGDACDAVDDRNSGGEEIACGPSGEEQAMLEAVNDFRSQPRECGSRGSFPAATPLTWRCELKSAALAHSMDMANNNIFRHTGSDGSSAGERVTRAGYNWSAVGENIAAGIPLSGVSAVMQAWIDSPGHCANLMGASFSNFGAARYSNSSSAYDVYWTQVFGRPR